MSQKKHRQPPHFYQAYLHQDRAEVILIILWYTDHEQSTVQGLNFLIDANPPWNGAVKDIIVYPSCSPEQALELFIKPWRDRLHLLKEIGAVEAKKEVTEALLCNMGARIALPGALIAQRNPFRRYVLSLPDAPNARPFTIDDFDLLSTSGDAPETLRELEQSGGRMMRLPDGQEVLVMGKSEWAEELWGAETEENWNLDVWEDAWDDDPA
ncbi:MAG: hypothetical protein H0T73_21700 [Ardenticatenales bacterium]|nr:hypothetical protein [Ardenticatenales bacterium]